MKNLHIEIRKIKGIEKASIDLPFEGGVYAFVGNNGCGKSTLLLSLAQLIRPQNALWSLEKNDFCDDSLVSFSHDGIKDVWIPKKGVFTVNQNKSSRWINTELNKKADERYNNNIRANGMYEGSLFIGTRFNDSKKADIFVSEGKITENDLVSVDDYVKQQMSYVLHGDYSHYANLKRLKRRDLFFSDQNGKQQVFHFNNLPYFIDGKFGGIISQYRMSSGECLLVSLLHFIYNAIIRQKTVFPREFPLLMLLDEIDLALHPVAISRLIELFNKYVGENESLIVILTTHTPSVIRAIKPNNIFKLENNLGTIEVVNPCYPSYAIRDVYTADKYDYVLLCEDELSRRFIEKTIRVKNLCASKLVAAVPVGGWNNVLAFHNEVVSKNIFGVGTQVVSVLDGDVQEEAQKSEKYKGIPKMFLPIASIEKFLTEEAVSNRHNLKKTINDKYFSLKTLDVLKSDFIRAWEITNPQDMALKYNKQFYRELINDLEKRNIKESDFITSLCDDIFECPTINSNDFALKLGKFIS